MELWGFGTKLIRWSRVVSKQSMAICLCLGWLLPWSMFLPQDGVRPPGSGLAPPMGTPGLPLQLESELSFIER